MTGVNGIDVLQKATEGRPVAAPARKLKLSPDSAGDRLEISTAARDAATVARLVAQEQTRPDLRETLVEQARQELEEGTYRLQQIVVQVAAQVGRYL